MRVFVALPLPPVLEDALCDVQERVLDAAPVGRAVPLDRMHVTLAFCSDAPPRAVEDWNDFLQDIPFAGVALRCTGLDSFTDPERGLVFMGLDPDPGLVELQRKVARSAEMAGLHLPRRRFRPHVTLIRGNRQPSGALRDRLAAVIAHKWPVPDVVAQEMGLFASTLHRDGARHDLLASYPANLP